MQVLPVGWGGEGVVGGGQCRGETGLIKEKREVFSPQLPYSITRPPPPPPPAPPSHSTGRRVPGFTRGYKGTLAPSASVSQWPRRVWRGLSGGRNTFTLSYFSATGVGGQLMGGRGGGVRGGGHVTTVALGAGHSSSPSADANKHAHLPQSLDAITHLNK